jgi:hypothetical protein
MPRKLASPLAFVAALCAASAAGCHPRDQVAADPSAAPATAVGAEKPSPRQQGLGAFFDERSYAPGRSARLELRFHAAEVRVRIFEAGPEAHRSLRRDTMTGVARSAPIVIRSPGRAVLLQLGDWPSGLYFARVSAAGRIGYAPFVLRPRRLGEARVAVVLPTNTWQAYNFLDADGDGVGDTWYADATVHTVDLRRPFAQRGVPLHFGGYDSGFLYWLAHSDRDADVLSDDDLARFATGDKLARLYDLIVFPGHEEYVTGHAYDIVTRYRDLGGNLAFLSANNFFYRVVQRGHRLLGRTRWRDLGRPEAALVGIQYLDWFQNRYPNRPYEVVDARRYPWLFRDTGLDDGDRFGRYGIEIDARTRASPPRVHVLARIPDAFGPGRSAEMTYYETPRGAKVFAAGTINFGGTAAFPIPSRMLVNLWRQLSGG